MAQAKAAAQIVEINMVLDGSCCSVSWIFRRQSSRSGAGRPIHARVWGAAPAPEKTIALTGRRRSLDRASVYLPSQVTLLFQSTNAPSGFSRQAQTCSSKCAGKPYRFGL
jgi:hypothetical protein